MATATPHKISTYRTSKTAAKPPVHKCDSHPSHNSSLPNAQNLSERMTLQLRQPPLTLFQYIKCPKLKPKNDFTMATATPHTISTYRTSKTEAKPPFHTCHSHPSHNSSLPNAQNSSERMILQLRQPPLTLFQYIKCPILTPKNDFTMATATPHTISTYRTPKTQAREWLYNGDGHASHNFVWRTAVSNQRIHKPLL